MKTGIDKGLRFAGLLLCALLLPGVARAVSGDVTYTFTDFQLTPAAVKRVTQTPLEPFADYNGAILSVTPRSLVTGTNGSVTFSNTVYGYSYRVTLDTLYGSTVRTSGFPATLSGNVNGRDYLGEIRRPNFFYLYGFGSNIVGAVSQAMFVTASVLTNAVTNLFGNASSVSNVAHMAQAMDTRVLSAFTWTFMGDFQTNFLTVNPNQGMLQWGGSNLIALTNVVVQNGLFIGNAGGLTNFTIGSVYSDDYGGGQPSTTPTTAGATAIDTSTGRVWQWWAAAWH